MQARRTIRFVPLLLLVALSVIGSFGAGYFAHPTSPTPTPASQTTTIEETVVVARVLDGDTIELADGRRVRYAGINAPESNEEFATEARELNNSLVFGKIVRLELGEEKFDIYGRTLGFVWLPDGSMVNEIMVKEGSAEAVAYYGKKSKYFDRLVAAQDDAKAQRRGMWELDGP